MTEKGITLEDLDKLASALIQKDQRIAELEEENNNLKLCRCKECQSENEFMLQNLVHDLEEENAKLQEQLKNAIVPKYKVGDTIWCASKKEPNIYSFLIKEIEIFRYSNKTIVCYYGEIKWCYEHEAFATEVEANEHLKEVKK